MKKSIAFRGFIAAIAGFLAGLAEKAFIGVSVHMARSGLILGAGEVTAASFAQGSVVNPNQSEIIRNRLYDWQLYPAAGASQLSFFSLPAGQGVTTALGATVGQSKSFWDTNMSGSGLLPSGQAYLIQSLEVAYMPGSVATANTYTPANLAQWAAVSAAALSLQLNDVNTFYQSGLLELSINGKNYLRETPLTAFPPKTGLDISASNASNSATTAQVSALLAKAAGRPYYLQPEITLKPAVSFTLTLSWPAPVAVPSGFNARVGVIFDGCFMRST